MKCKRCAHGLCNSDTRYSDKPYMHGVTFYSFPNAANKYESRLQWVLACNRLGFDINCVNRSSFVCSKHFVDPGGPSEKNPNPVFATGSDGSCRSRRRLRTTHESNPTTHESNPTTHESNPTTHESNPTTHESNPTTHESNSFDNLKIVSVFTNPVASHINSSSGAFVDLTNQTLFGSSCPNASTNTSDNASPVEKKVLSSLQDIKESLQHYGCHLSQGLQVLEPNPIIEEVEGVPELPLKNMEEFSFVETLMAMDTDVKKYLLEKLGSIGGNSISEVTRKIMRRLLSRFLALHFNWCGRRGKTPFRNFKIKNVVIDAVRENGKLRSAKDKEIEDAIKLFLKNTRDRMSIRTVLTSA